MKHKTKFGKYGGVFVSETLIPILEEVEEAYFKFYKDKQFQKELKELLENYAGRPTPLYFAKNFSKQLGFKVYLKREDLLHSGAHKINNSLGQGLLAKYMGKKRIIAETGAGQHGVSAAMVGALFGMETCIYMGVEDIKRQEPNVFRMRLCGAKVIPVEISKGKGTLCQAVNEALRDWVTNPKTTYYLLGSVVGPHPYPTMVRNFQKIISQEIKSQILKFEKKLPDYVIACVGGGSNSIGAFWEFLRRRQVKLIGVEAGGQGINTGKHCASISKGEDGILHGSLSKVLQNKDGQILEGHSVSAGLDYPGVGPEHGFLAQSKRVIYSNVTDKEAISAFKTLCKTEGIIPALESAHAAAYVIKHKRSFSPKDIVVINLSGRGDKDLGIINQYDKK